MQDPKQKTRKASIRHKSSTVSSSYSQIMRDINDLQKELADRLKIEDKDDEVEKRKEAQIPPKQLAQKKARKQVSPSKMRQRGKLLQGVQKAPRREVLQFDLYQLDAEDYLYETDLPTRIQMKSVQYPKRYQQEEQKSK